MTLAVQRTEAWASRARSLADKLGLSAPVAPEVLHHLAQDPNYGVNLLIARGNEPVLRALLGRSPARGSAPFDEDAALAKVDEALEDIDAVSAICADADTVARREQACLACPDLVGTPQQLKRLAVRIEQAQPPGWTAHDLHCLACGCQLGRKLRWLTQHCPRPHAEQPGLTRWGEVAP
jgi:hypothetical protein